MNWDAIGAVAEAIGAAAVVASLLYLALQIRASTRASAVESKLQTTRLLTEVLDSYIHTPELNELQQRGSIDLESLSKEEYLQFSNMALKMFWFFSAAHFQFQKGTLADSDWYEVRVAMQYWLRGAGIRAWWLKFGRESFGNDFRGFIDAEITSLETA